MSKRQLPAQRPSPFKYEDYRSFLKDYFEYLKVSGQARSHREVARRTGIQQSNLSSVLNGKKPMTQTMVQTLVELFKLSIDEAGFFKHLVTFGDSKDHTERMQAFQAISGYKPYRTEHAVDVETSEYLTHWHYGAIRLLSFLPDFKLDATWIRSRLRHKLSQSKIDEAIRFLVDHGYLVKNARGKYSAREKKIASSGNVTQTCLAESHRALLNLAIESIYQTDREERWLTAKAITIPARKFAEVQRRYEAFLASLEEDLLTSPEAADTVLNMSIALFPLTKKLK